MASSNAVLPVPLGPRKAVLRPMVRSCRSYRKNCTNVTDSSSFIAALLGINAVRRQL